MVEGHYKTSILLQIYTWKQQTGHQCHWWVKWPSTFTLLILNFCTPSLYVTNYQKMIFYSASMSRKGTCYLTAGNWIDNYSCREKAHSWLAPGTVNNITVIKSTLKIQPRHNGAIPIKSNGNYVRDHIAYFISNQHTKKGLDPYIHVIDSTYDIKGTSTLYIIVANYTNKHVTFNKGQYIGHMEPCIDNMHRHLLIVSSHRKLWTNNFNQTLSSPLYTTFPKK